eukprot:scaffold18319_cov29-Prasinocladus_malaysianus.AAC.4
MSGPTARCRPCRPCLVETGLPEDRTQRCPCRHRWPVAIRHGRQVAPASASPRRPYTADGTGTPRQVALMNIDL